MSRRNNKQSAQSGNGSSPFVLPVMLLLFVGSGCSALIYEIVWFQLLRLVIGSSGVSIGVLLGTYMGGMCVGSLAMPYFISSSRHPFRVYAVLELLIGVFGLILLALIPLIGQFYLSFVGHGIVSILMRGALAVICLLPPTILMGATLPAIARWVESSSEGVGWLGFFYGSNIAGAVFGCLLAGFYLLRIYDVATATYVAVGINVIVAAIAAGVSLLAPKLRRATDASVEDQQASSARVQRNWLAYVIISISGVCSLGCEVIWTRQLSLLLGASVYTFSIILAVFLTGLGIGSTVGSFLAQKSDRPSMLLGWCQGLLAICVLWAAYCMSVSLPYWPIDPRMSSDPWQVFQLDIARCFWAMLPAAILWGASFPLALASVTAKDVDTGKMVGGVYAANTVGAIVGAVAVSMVLIPSVGTQMTHEWLIGLTSVSAVLAFSYVTLRERDLRGMVAPLCSILLLGGLGYFAVRNVPSTPTGLIAYGRTLSYQLFEYGEPEYIYAGEGRNASIAVSETLEGYRNFHVSGKVVASDDPYDMRLQLMLGHLPGLMHDSPKSALIVGCGAGVTSGTFIIHPDFERIVICEIEPLIPSAAGEHFGEANNFVMDDPRVEIVFDDARHFIATTDEKFDIITSDPIHPWVKGAAALYSREYYELCKKRLNPGGYVTQWVPLYESSEAAVKSEVMTFLDAFPSGSIWGNDIDGGGYDVVMLGQAEEKPIDFDLLKKKMSMSDQGEPYHQVVRALETIELGTPVDIILKYAGDNEDLRDWLADAEMNRDSNLRLQFLAGMGLNQFEAESIYRQMLSRRTYPERHVTASSRDEALLRSFFVDPEDENF